LPPNLHSVIINKKRRERGIIMATNLTERQNYILNYIINSVKTKGFPPSVREIGEATGLKSSSTVHSHLVQLEKKGYIRRDPTKPRTIEVLLNDFDCDESAALNEKDFTKVPLLGKVAAGTPIFAEQNIEEYYNLPKNLVSNDNVFCLRVQGDSMINAGIYEDDLLIVRQQITAQNGEIVVALIDDEATVKRLYLEKNHIRLQPENENYEPIITREALIVGKVIGVYRSLY